MIPIFYNFLSKQLAGNKEEAASFQRNKLKVHKIQDLRYGRKSAIRKAALYQDPAAGAEVFSPAEKLSARSFP